MHIDHVDWQLCAIGSIFVIIGVSGLFKKTVTVRGRVGPARTYTGRQALWRSLLGIAIGIVAMAISMMDLK
jgi:hypothetical protein